MVRIAVILKHFRQICYKVPKHVFYIKSQFLLLEHLTHLSKKGGGCIAMTKNLVTQKCSTKSLCYFIVEHNMFF